jgi:hypothetical protein
VERTAVRSLHRLVRWLAWPQSALRYSELLERALLRQLQRILEVIMCASTSAKRVQIISNGGIVLNGKLLATMVGVKQHYLTRSCLRGR